MIRVKSMQEMRLLPGCAAKRSMELEAALLLDADEELINQVEEEFDGPLGGDWYLFERNDDPHKFNLESWAVIDLLSSEWNWCDFAGLDSHGCYRVFWGTNNAGGPLLFVPDEPWLPVALKERLNNLIFNYEDQKDRIYGRS